MKISVERMQQYWIEGFYQAGLEFLKREDTNRAGKCFTSAYSLCLYSKDEEGMRVCLANHEFREMLNLLEIEANSNGEDLKTALSEMGKIFVEEIKKSEDFQFDENLEEEDIPDKLKETCLEHMILRE